MTALLDVEGLHVAVEGKEILRGIDLRIGRGEAHVLMGPNGSGKSTLGFVLAGREGYEVTRGRVLFDGRDLLAMPPEERATAGVFLAFQYPVEIPGVTGVNLLRHALNAVRRARGEPELDAMDLLSVIEDAAKELGMDASLLRRPLNVGFSGGEKKRNEVLQLAVLRPRLAILDETDSGLDVDALRTVAAGIEKMRNGERAFLLITHYERLLEHVRPDRVHVLAEGRIVATGGVELAKKVQEEGYAGFLAAR